MNPSKHTSKDHSYTERLVDLYRTMFMARELDKLEEQYVNRGEAFFTVSGAGHESVAALNEHLIEEDYLHLHYRDKALMLARGIPPKEFFLGLFCKAGSSSHGRQMSAHLSDRQNNIVNLSGPVGNNALQAVGIASEICNRPEAPIVVCAMGDGTSQQGEVLEAIAEAVRWQLPVLFLIEDNQLAISTRTTGKTFFDLPEGAAPSYYGIPIHQLDGKEPLACGEQFGDIVSAMRENRRPAIIRLAVARLSNHTNADDQAVYRESEEIAQLQDSADPVKNLHRQLIESDVDADILSSIETAVREELNITAQQALSSADPEPIFDAKRVLPESLFASTTEYRGTEDGRELTMLEAIRGVLHDRLSSDPHTTLYGEDIEDPKGDVFGVTHGLSSEFPARVSNSPLSESTIVGTAIGRALAGGRPVAFLQFADFLPIAFNQIASELGSMHWRTGGSWECPVVIMIAAGGYRPGLGPFHAQTMESLAAHTPGIDVLMPSNASDAAGLLNSAFESRRPTLFFYPKNGLNLSSPKYCTSHDIGQQRVPLGKARSLRKGDDITLIGYGNTVTICEEVADALATADITTDLIDLRSLSPWDEDAVITSAEKTRHLIVVHEDNRTCGFGAEILATVMEKASASIKARRVVRDDTYIPTHFGNQLEVLPSFKRVLSEAADLLGLDLEWLPLPPVEPDQFIINAIGTAPSDQSVILLEWMVSEGDTINAGDPLACFEGSKAAFDLDSPVSGIVVKLLIKEEQEIGVGQAIMHVRLAEGEKVAAAIPSWEPLISKRQAPQAKTHPSTSELSTRASSVGIIAVASELGEREVTNDELIREHWKQNSADIERMTGIHTRRRIGSGQDVVSLGTRAAAKVLQQTGFVLSDIDLVICATGSPEIMSPSVACLILERLGGSANQCPAFDFSAACTGYIYGLKIAYDHLRHQPNDRILLITSETVSPLIDNEDFGTSILFADAATATILGGSSHHGDFRLTLRRPFISAYPESGQILRAPHVDSPSHLSMDGMKVFEMGVRYMTSALQKVCTEANMETNELDLLVPHQANLRIINTIASRQKIPLEKVYVNVMHTGNTSSSTIPICLAELFESPLPYNTIGITAFGAGFTYGAAILDVVNHTSIKEKE